jgi:gliding motility-associated-like protein
MMLLIACGCGLVLFNIPGAAAQGCTGYALYKEDFGGNASSPAMGAPLPDSVTSYSYTTNTPVEDGQYGIRKEVTGHTGTWHHGGDHTGDGYMMLINASYDAGLFYQTRINALCQGSAFYFSAWIANLMRPDASGPLDPNIRFEILRPSDSSLIGEYTTGPIPRSASFTWKQYGIHFALPAGESSVILRMYNNQTGGNGNDLVLDDITFSLCGPAIELSTMGTYQKSQDACAGNRISLSAAIQAGFYKDPKYQWQFSTDNMSWQNLPDATTTTVAVADAGPSDSGWYRILVAESGNITSTHCRIASDALPLRIWSPQPFSIDANSPVCEGTPLKLSAPPALTYRWEGPGGFSSEQPAVQFDHAAVNQQGTYALTRVTSGGCETTAQVTVSVQPDDLKLSLGNDSLLCEGSLVPLNAANPGATYEWNTGEQTSGILADTSGFYKVTVRKGICQASDSIRIREILTPVVHLGDDTTICIGEPLLLDAAFSDAQQYLWQDGSTDSAYRVSRTGTYVVTISNQCGMASGSIHVTAETCADHLVFPTAFSPNGDGQNDFFRPRVFLRVSHYSLEIFDRWGRSVFRSTDPDAGWEGTRSGMPLGVGTYIWIAHYTRESDHQPVSQKGSVTLIR